MLTLIKITCCQTYAKHYQQSSQALKIRSAGLYLDPGPRQGGNAPGRHFSGGGTFGEKKE